MKSLRVSLFISMLAVLAQSVFCEAPAVRTDISSSKASGSHMVTLDMAAIIDPRNPAESKSEEWKESFEAFTKSLEKEQKALQELQTKLESKYKDLEAKQKEGKPTKEETAEIQRMIQELQLKNQQLTQEAQEKFIKIQEEFRKEINAAAKAIAEKKDYDPVIHKDVIIYSKNVTDITSEVITELNSRHAAKKRAKKMTTEKTTKPESKTTKA